MDRPVAAAVAQHTQIPGIQRQQLTPSASVLHPRAARVVTVCPPVKVAIAAAVVAATRQPAGAVLADRQHQAMGTSQAAHH